MYEMYESLSSDTLTHNSLVAQKRFRSPPTVPTYDRVNSSALQAMAAQGTHGRVIVNDAKPVINNMSAKMTGVVDDLCGQ